MATTLFDFKARNRHLTAVSTPSPPPEPAESTAVEVVPVLTAMERMSKKNPALLLLIETLDLTEVYSVQPTEESQPVTDRYTPAAKPASPKRLEEIALLAFKPDTGYTREEALTRLSEQTGVPIERASNGLALMIDQRLLNLTSGGIYHLFDSTPF